MTVFYIEKTRNFKLFFLCGLLAIAVILSTGLTIGADGSHSGSTKEDFIRWVDFRVPLAVLQQAFQYDVDTFGTERHVDWIHLIAIAACHNGGRFRDGRSSVIDEYAERLKAGECFEKLTENMEYITYYVEAFSAVLSGLVGEYIDENGEKSYGLTAFSPIAYGYGYSHARDFGLARSYGFKRRHLGNDLMGSIGTPIIAVEGGIVEHMGWNRYGGWRVGIRSHDKMRYYYYAHLRRGHPFVRTLVEGDEVAAGDVIGYLGMTGYSEEEDYNGMSVPHLHFGMQLIFDESQVEGSNEIWVDVYNIVRFLHRNRSRVHKPEGAQDYVRSGATQCSAMNSE